MIQAFLDFEEWIMAIHRKFEANKEQHKEDSLLKTESSKKHEPTSKEVSQQVMSTKDHEPASMTP